MRPDASFVVANAETGLLVVRATGRQHERVQQFLDMMLRSAHRQVLIEATVAEVQLSDQYQQGINWQKLNSGSFKATQQPMGPAPLPGGSIPSSGPGGITYPPSRRPSPTPAWLVLQYVSAPGSFLGNVSAAVSLLESFGTVKVLSSPKLSVLNNQTAFLKVVDNRIYFTIGVQITPGTTCRHPTDRDLHLDAGHRAGWLRHERHALNRRSGHGHDGCTADDFAHHRLRQ